MRFLLCFVLVPVWITITGIATGITRSWFVFHLAIFAPVPLLIWRAKRAEDTQVRHLQQPRDGIYVRSSPSFSVAAEVLKARTE